MLVCTYFLISGGISKGMILKNTKFLVSPETSHNSSIPADSIPKISPATTIENFNSSLMEFTIGPSDTLPKAKTDTLKSKDISKESIEDSDFVIKNPRHTIKIIRSPKDKLGKPFLDTRANSRKAWMYSLVVPGLGQYYNHSYLKIPIVYGLLVTMGVFISFNQTNYQELLSAFRIKSSNLTQDQIVAEFSRLNIPPEYADPRITPAIISPIKDFYRRNRDLSIIGAVGVWAINAIDAFVVSELKGFDVSNDLSIRIRPSITPGLETGSFSHLNTFNPMIKLTLNFK